MKTRTLLADRRFAAKKRETRLDVLREHQAALTVIVCDLIDVAWSLENEATAAA